MGVLDGIKVLEMARVPPAEMPGMFLADMGADVLKIETPPESHRGRGHQAARRLRLRQPQQALARAQHEGARGAGDLQEARRLRRRHRGGLPPRRDEAAGGRLRDALRHEPAAGVLLALRLRPQRALHATIPPTTATTSRSPACSNLIGEPDRKPIFPLNLVADYGGASMHGALGIMMALFARERTGRGQHVDVSYLDTSLALLAATPNMRFFWSDGMAPKRGEGFLGGSYPYYAVYETKDAQASSPSGAPSPGCGRTSARRSTGRTW